MKKWGAHIFAWLAYILLEFLANYFHYRRTELTLLWLNIFIYLPAIIISTYAVVFFLVPQYLIKGKNWSFSLGILIILIFVFFSRYHIANWEFTLAEKRSILLPFSKITKNVIRDYAVIALASCILIINNWRLLSQKMRLFEKTNAELELALLLNKLQPHFLFNTFNNIYSLIRKDPERGADALLQLSSVLEYIVYLKPSEKVALIDELKILRKYVDLQRLKYGSQLDYQENIDPRLHSAPLPSLVLLSLIENAFKHGARKNDVLSIHLHIQSQGGEINFEVKNTFNQDQKRLKENHLGNKNLQERLSLFYGPKAQLIASPKEDIFSVCLNIPHYEV